eukprot:jgi/Galph1/3682/GphlegSOOS_G2325.1
MNLATPSKNVLTEEQKRAIYWNNSGTLIISACPGSGKTLVLVHRVAFWIDTLKIPPRDILLITFTRSACNEIRDRLRQIISTKVVDDLRVWTFHSLGLRMVRNIDEGILKEKFGVTKNFSIFSTSEQKKILEKVILELEEWGSKENEANQKLSIELRTKSISNRELSSLLFCIQKHKASMTVPAQGRLATLFKNYNSYLKSCNGMDFSDLLSCATQIAQEGTVSRQKVLICRYHYAIVDEYQDCSTLNKEFLRALLSDNAHITLIGDDDQSIYGFQGAEGGPLEPIKHSSSSVTNCTSVTLSSNFRSSQNIVSCISALILRNELRAPKSISSCYSTQGDVEVRVCRNERCEFMALLQSIQHLLSNNVAPNKIAILLRTRTFAFELLSYLRNCDIPCKMLSEASQSTGDDWELLPNNGQDLCILIVRSFCKLMLNVKDDIALLLIIVIFHPEIPHELISQWKTSYTNGPSLLQVLRESFKTDTFDEKDGVVVTIFLKGTPLAVLSEEIVDLLPIEIRRRIGDRDLFVSKQIFQKAEMALNRGFHGHEHYSMENKESTSFAGALVSLSKSRRKEIGVQNGNYDLYRKLRLYVDSLEEIQSEYETQLQKTIASSVGKEWDHVHVLRLNEDWFPLKPRPYAVTEENISTHYEEERRIAYVAFSRAREGLYLSYIEEEGEGRPLFASRFLREIPENVTKRMHIDNVEEFERKWESNKRIRSNEQRKRQPLGNRKLRKEKKAK